MMTLMSSLVTGSKIIFTSRFTTASAIFGGITRPNISTNSLVRSGWPSLDGRYIIGRESPYTANEKAEPAADGACWAVAGTLATITAPNSANRPRHLRWLIVMVSSSHCEALVRTYGSIAANRREGPRPGATRTTQALNGRPNTGRPS